MRYAHVVGATRITPIWFKLAAAARDCYCRTLENACQSTAHCLGLSPPVIAHRLADMVRDICFATRDYSSLTAGASTFLFVAHTAATADKLRAKARLWDNMLRGNVHPSIVESSQLLAIGIGPCHFIWVTAEAAAEGLTTLLVTL